MCTSSTGFSRSLETFWGAQREKGDEGCSLEENFSILAYGLTPVTRETYLRMK